jgi:hypothetical protein
MKFLDVLNTYQLLRRPCAVALDETLLAWYKHKATISHLNARNRVVINTYGVDYCVGI